MHARSPEFNPPQLQFYNVDKNFISLKFVKPNECLVGRWCEALYVPFNWKHQVIREVSDVNDQECGSIKLHNNKWYANERKPEKTSIRLGFAV